MKATKSPRHVQVLTKYQFHNNTTAMKLGHALFSKLAVRAAGEQYICGRLKESRLSYVIYMTKRSIKYYLTWKTPKGNTPTTSLFLYFSTSG